MFRFCFHTTHQCIFSELRSIWNLGRTWSIRHQAKKKQLIFLKTPIKWMAWITLKVFSSALHWQAYPFFTRLETGETSQDQGRTLETRITILFQLHFEKLRHFLKMNIFMKLLQQGTINLSVSRRSVATATEKKNNPLHQLKLSICILRSCTVAEKVGFCNHVSALMLKVSKCSLYKAKQRSY